MFLLILLALLKKSGFFSLKDLIVSGPFEVSSETGIDIDESFLIFNQALTALEDIGLIEKQFIPATLFIINAKILARFLLVQKISIIF